jgi:transcription elongation factor Elf1
MTIDPDGMPLRAAPPPEFPATCPNCNTQSGVPRSVSTTTDGGTFVIVVCHQCAQEWRVDRKPDRLDHPITTGKD